MKLDQTDNGDGTITFSDPETGQTWPPIAKTEIARRKADAEARRAQKSSTISSLDFFNRFTDQEKVAVYAAATANPVIGVGLTHGLAAGRIDLTDAAVIAWTDGLVAESAITADRKTEILTP